MNKPLVKVSEANVQKTPPSSLTGSLVGHTEKFMPEIRKHLGTWGKLSLLGVWSLVILLVGYRLANKSDSNSQHLAELEEQVIELKQLQLQKVEDQKNHLDAKVRVLLEKLDRKYEQAQVKIDEKTYMLEKEKEDIIDSLQAELSYKNFSLDQLQKGERGSKQSMPYSTKNADILRFEHEQKVKKLKRMHYARESLFIKNGNLAEPKQKKALQEMQEKHELELFTLKRTLREERASFRKNKYYVKK